MTEEEKAELIERSLEDVAQTINHFHAQQANGVMFSDDRIANMCKNLSLCLEAVTCVLEFENE